MIKLKEMIDLEAVESHSSVPDSATTAPVALPTPIDGKTLNRPAKLTREEKSNLMTLVREFHQYREAISVADRMRDVSEKILYIAEMTGKYGMNETSEWFEGVGLEKDMDSLKKMAADLHKTSAKIYPEVKKMESVYESVGIALEKYYSL